MKICKGCGARVKYDPCGVCGGKAEDEPEEVVSGVAEEKEATPHKAKRK